MFPTSRMWLAAFAAVAAALRLFFWTYTHRTWEDALITVLHAENFFAGIGLTHYKVDEGRIHGFTSPLSVLVPLLGEWVHRGAGMAFLKAASVVSGALAVWLVWRIARAYPELRLSLAGFSVAAGLVAIEHHQILWGMAGMETQMVVAALLASAWSLRLPGRPALQGALLALCVYARPDFAFWVLIALADLTLQARRRRSYGDLVRAAVWAASLYLPWLLFTTLYYGSPVPNTILAKSAGYGIWWHGAYTPVTAAQHVGRILTEQLFSILGPAFGGHGTGFAPLFDGFGVSRVMLGFFVYGAGVALWRRQYGLWVLYAFVIVYTLYFVVAVPTIFGWYVVPLAAMTGLLAAKGIGDAMRTVRLGVRGEAVVAAAYVVCLAAALAVTFPAERAIQTWVEEGVRRRVGEYLGGTMRLDQRVALEPLGYVGYYSRRSVYEYPGLASRRVVECERLRPTRHGLLPILDYLRPDFVVLRPSEYAEFTRKEEGRFLALEYEAVRRFQVDERGRREMWEPWRNVDLEFVVMRRNW